MDETAKRELCRQLGAIDTSLFFLIVLIAATALSWKGTAIQREGLCRVLLGEGETVPDVRPIRRTVSALVLGALTFFFCLALETSCTAGGGAEQASAQRNLAASALVLAAAMIRQCDLECQNDPAPAGETEEELPI